MSICQVRMFTIANDRGCPTNTWTRTVEVALIQRNYGLCSAWHRAQSKAEVVFCVDVSLRNHTNQIFSLTITCSLTLVDDNYKRIAIILNATHCSVF